MKATNTIIIAITVFLFAATPAFTAKKSEHEHAKSESSLSLNPEQRIFYFDCTVQLSEVNKNIFILRASNGTIFDPMNFPKEYSKEGMRLNVAASIQEDLVGINMVGEIIKIISVQVLKNE